ncbi:MAG: 2,3-epoxybenzoyl-CoA dihydrolase [Alphaproteobacteria bacterium]|nr:2,3-epoxybenzoyl-CoA dihydrolase [Alphaproteobacteria bacterium]
MQTPTVEYQTDPSQYKHWSVRFDGEIATLQLNINEDGGIRPGYKLKHNSYDLGVDIELHDALQRIRFEHPEIKSVVVTSLRDRIFCSGANIFMLGLSTHAWKVNFCKFTNETRNGFEDSSRHDGLKFLAAVNGACAGGGYELALACDQILLVDDRSSAVSLPEVPLLGVLPGTGGLTRVTDKRHVRHDHADLFCTSVEGVRGQRAVDWRLVDAIAKPAQFAEQTQNRAQILAAQSKRPGLAGSGQGVKLNPLKKQISADGIAYEYVQVQIDRAKRTATLTVSAPKSDLPTTPEAMQAQGDAWYPLQMARELDDAILSLRTNELDIGTWLLRTTGEAALARQSDQLMVQHQSNWLVNETLGLLRRTLARFDVSSRSLFALIDEGSCFIGTLAELAFAADRAYMLDLPDTPERAPRIELTELNLGRFPMVNRQNRLQRRFYEETAPMAQVASAVGQSLDASKAMSLGLVTSTPDDIDWDDEIRLAIEERAAMSPDGLTGLEANLRFASQETMETRIFGRLSAWQNWIFNRPNAVGEKGALKVFGKGEKAAFDLNRA